MALSGAIRGSPRRPWAVAKGTAFAAGAVCLASVVASVLLVGAAAHAGFPDMSRPYTQSTDGDCIDDAIDPINILFIGGRAGVDGVANNFAQHDPIYGPGQGSTQRLQRRISDSPLDYRCHTQDAQRANGATDETRHHVRLWFIPASSGSDTKTVGDGHHEDWREWPACGDYPTDGDHAVDANGSNGSGFDKGRRRIRDQFADGGHYVENPYWGNDHPFQQCDGEWASSNGNGARIWVGHLH
jgi:hypothetical protein